MRQAGEVLEFDTPSAKWHDWIMSRNLLLSITAGTILLLVITMIIYLQNGGWNYYHSEPVPQVVVEPVLDELETVDLIKTDFDTMALDELNAVDLLCKDYEDKFFTAPLATEEAPLSGITATVEPTPTDIPTPSPTE